MFNCSTPVDGNGAQNSLKKKKKMRNNKSLGVRKLSSPSTPRSISLLVALAIRTCIVVVVDTLARRTDIIVVIIIIIIIIQIHSIITTKYCYTTVLRTSGMICVMPRQRDMYPRDCDIFDQKLHFLTDPVRIACRSTNHSTSH
jgi:hypothetical protein